MQLPQLLKHYSLNPQQLLKLLNENGFKPDLKFIKQVPKEWYPVLSGATAIEPPVLASEATTAVYSPTLKAVDNEVKPGKLSLTDLNIMLHNEPIILSGQEPPLKNNESRKEPVKKDFFWAYVKFVAPDNTHGFVKRLFNLENIGREVLHAKDDNDYSLRLEGTFLERDQLIVCSDVGTFKGKKQARIEAVSFTGVVKEKDGARKAFDLSSPLCPQTFPVFRNTILHKANTLSSFTLSVVKGHFQANQILKEGFQVKLNDYRNLESFKRLFNKQILSEEEIETLQVISVNIDNKDDLYKIYSEAFDKEKEILNHSLNEQAIARFLDKWFSICPDLLSIEKIQSLIYNDFYWDRWLKGKLPINFWGPNLVSKGLEYLFNKPFQEHLTVFLIFKKNLSNAYDDLYPQLVVKYLQSFVEIDSDEKFTALINIAETLGSNNAEVIFYELYSLLTDQAKVEAWFNNQLLSFPREEALKLFETFNSEEQDQVVQNLDDKEFSTVFKSLNPSNNSATLLRSKGLLEKEIISALTVISLDIESDGEEIFELAWGNTEEWVSGIDSDEVGELIGTLQDHIIEKDPLLVGHNITDFDCPILEKNGLRIIKDRIWDTLLVEMALSPELKTYALRTTHHALEDARLAIRLFSNQVIRLLFLDEDNWDSIKNIFPGQTRDALEGFRATMAFSWLNSPGIYTEHHSFFRPQPGSSSLLLELKNRVEASTAKAKVILASADYWEELRVIPGIQFFSQEHPNDRFKELEEEKVLDQLKDHAFEYTIANRFFSYCRQTGTTPIVVNLPPILRLRLDEKVDFAGCTINPAEPEWQKEQIACLDIYELAKQEEKLLNADNAEIFIIEPDLISLTFKVLLKEVNLAYVIDNPAVKHLWIKFSGGQSFIELSKDQAISLGVEIPDGIENFWIEKFVYGKYRIWGNYNWEHHLAGFPPERISIINRGKADFPKDQAKYLVVDQKKLQNDIGITRFNPESIYRSRYWVVQKELIEGIAKVENEPLVLLIQRKDELEPVQQYFHSLGYYIPSIEISLSRRLELLHQSNKRKKIIIATVPEASHIINANYLGPLNFVWDSFNLYENFYLAKGSNLFRKSITESAEFEGTPFEGEKEGMEEEASLKVNPSDSNTFLQRDIFFLLKLQVPLINRLRSLLSDDNPANKLWLLDARIEDFASLGDEWNAKKTAFKVWEKKEAYDKDAEIADGSILSPKPSQDLPFSTEEAKEILRSVFLPENANWHDYQIPYLEKILPAKNNILVSLPTGGGKSLLFQAPALFRSSFTNRLSIVITPLKALMEDQVKALWDLGFYGSVEYINQDKSDEVLQIYRRLAGGEISLLFITPERFRSGGFIKAFTQRFENDGGLEYAVYDEAHCISQWGHEFRPDYLYSGKRVQRFKDMNERKFPVLLFSATISEKIYRDLNLIFK